MSAAPQEQNGDGVTSFSLLVPKVRKVSRSVWLAPGEVWAQAHSRDLTGVGATHGDPVIRKLRRWAELEGQLSYFRQ